MFLFRLVTEEAQENDRFIGKLVSDRYRVLRKIGEGGMGVVYEALHETIEKKIALKVLHARYSASQVVVSRFKQEAISASRIKHQNVIDVFDFGQLGDGSCFIAMEYLEGLDLGAALERRRKFRPEEAIRIAVQMCSALGLGHGRGVIHRDLKPENVFLQRTPEGEELVKIVDFGIAQLRGKDDAVEEEEQVRRRRLTKTGMIFGTPEYMAPEQARGAAIDQRSDIYSTGVILYELLTGAVPFLGESFLEVLNQHVQSAVPPFSRVNPEGDVSEELEKAVMRALEKDPDYRYPTMKDFATALLRTPEGRRAERPAIAAPEEDDERREVLIENSRYPKAQSGGSTAMFGSAGEPSEPPPPMTAAQEEEDAAPPAKKSKTGLVVSLLVLLLGATVAGYVFVVKKRAPPAPEVAARAPEVPASRTESPVVEAPPEPAPRDTSPPSEPTPPEPTPSPPKMALLKITSEPLGAVIKKDGFQVCDSTPCEVSVDLGEAATFTAEKGTASGEAKVLAQRDQEVMIRLRAAPKSVPRPRPEGAPTPTPSPALCEVMVEGIKILRPCE
jgi:serine/threonine protein kinase